MSCESCKSKKTQGTEESPLDGLAKDLFSMSWDDVKNLISTSKKIRLWAIISTTVATVLIVLGVVGLPRVQAQDQEIKSLQGQIHSLQGELDAINDILEEGVVVEETTTTETTTPQTVEGDSAVINNGSMEQYNDNAMNGGGN